jgi:hypothetical protein
MRRGFYSRRVEETYLSSKLSLSRTRPENERISKMGRSGEETNLSKHPPRSDQGSTRGWWRKTSWHRNNGGFGRGQGFDARMSRLAEMTLVEAVLA